MGEYYELINIDKREWQGSWGKLMEFLFCAYPGKAAHWLLHPIVLPPMPHLPPHEHSQEVGNGSKAGGKHGFIGVHSMKLPLELFTHIAAHQNSFVDVICLAATCHAMWEVCALRLSALLAAQLGNSWAGNRVLCMGDYADERVANKLLTAEERAELEGEYDTLYYLASEEYAKVSRKDQLMSRWGDMLAYIRQKRKVVGAPLALLEAARPAHLRAPAVLRNLSTKKYVRARVLDTWNKKSRRRGSHDVDVELGTAMVVAVGLGQELHGAWIGGRMDIVSESKMEREGTEGWEDQSDAFLKKLAYMVLNYGY